MEGRPQLELTDASLWTATTDGNGSRISFLVGITGGVRVNDKGRGQIDGSDVVLAVGHGRSAAKAAWITRGFLGIWQDASVYAVPRVHPGNVGLTAFVTRLTPSRG